MIGQSTSLTENSLPNHQSDAHHPTIIRLEEITKIYGSNNFYCQNCHLITHGIPKKSLVLLNLFRQIYGIRMKTKTSTNPTKRQHYQKRRRNVHAQIAWAHLQLRNPRAAPRRPLLLFQQCW